MTRRRHLLLVSERPITVTPGSRECRIGYRAPCHLVTGSGMQGQHRCSARIDEGLAPPSQRRPFSPPVRGWERSGRSGASGSSSTSMHRRSTVQDVHHQAREGCRRREAVVVGPTRRCCSKATWWPVVERLGDVHGVARSRIGGQPAKLRAVKGMKATGAAGVLVEDDRVLEPGLGEDEVLTIGRNCRPACSMPASMRRRCPSGRRALERDHPAANVQLGRLRTVSRSSSSSTYCGGHRRGGRAPNRTQTGPARGRDPRPL